MCICFPVSESSPENFPTTVFFEFVVLMRCYSSYACSFQLDFEPEVFFSLVFFFWGDIFVVAFVILKM